MGDGGAGCCGGKGGAAGVGEEVKYFHGLSGGVPVFPNELREPVPVYRLLREQAGVLETEGL